MSIKLIAFDLDGTLLDKKKQIPPENLRALDRAYRAGAILVPATGRIYPGLPRLLREAPWARYQITANGASVYDAKTRTQVAQSLLDLDTSLQIIEHLAALPVIYDCYQEDWGYISGHMLDRAGDYIPDPGILKMMYELRTPVPELGPFLRERGRGLQKLQAHFTDLELREREIEELARLFPQTAVSSSLPWNIEINSAQATKGRALRQLCALLGIAPEETLAFGDGSNDLDMIEAAGIGVAMDNAIPQVKEKADWICPDNDRAGVAAGIARFLA